MMKRDNGNYKRILSMSSVKNAKKLYNEKETHKEYKDRIFFFISGATAMKNATTLELVSKELNHLAAILHVYAGGLNFMK